MARSAAKTFMLSSEDDHGESAFHVFS